MNIPNRDPLITVDELIAELQEISAKGYGECYLFVPCEHGYSGATIATDWIVDGDVVTLFSDDMYGGNKP